MISSFFVKTMPARQVAACRILLALAAIAKSWDLMWRLPGADSLTGWQFWLALWDIAAIALLVGFAPRVAGIGLFGLFWLFVGHGQYSNHFAFLAISVVLLALLDSGREWSVRPHGPDVVPSWPANLLQIHLGIVYLYSGLSKVSPGWASGSYLGTRLEIAMLAPTVTSIWLLAVAGTSTIVWEITAPFGLWWRRTRNTYIVIGFVAHLLMMLILSVAWTSVHRLGVFALAVFSIYVLWLPPRWFEVGTNDRASARSLRDVKRA